ncbi:signal recognition particle receptor subunit beta [Anomaloglossus baeobatrachus]|uniref:signal recognition particle receptor subunit beta n=1 Tax=Anomaloglossus baeobatrachus TaxID=238106 RepID=UPI003F4F8F05
MAAAVEESVSGQLLPDMDFITQELALQDPTVLSVLVALVVVLLSLVIWRLLRGRQSSRRAVLLVGLCDSGKSLLFCRLLNGKFRQTQTSISPNTSIYRGKNDKSSSFTLVDVPGHESLRLQFLDQYKTAVRAMIFVVDSSSFQREVKEVAEFLYHILTDATLLRNIPPILVACNKQDVSMAKSAKLIQQQLERELNTLRVTQSAAPSTLEGTNLPAAAQLGRKGKDFEFSQLPLKIEFVECNARDGKEEGDANLGNVEGWLAKLA